MSNIIYRTIIKSMKKFIIQLFISIFVVCCNSTIEHVEAWLSCVSPVEEAYLTALPCQIDTIDNNTLPVALFMQQSIFPSSAKVTLSGKTLRPD